MTKSSIALSDTTFLEWKLPTRVMASAEPSASDVVPAQRIVTEAHKDWVRLRIKLPSTPRTIKGFRIFLKILRNTSRMPVKVGVISSVSKGTRFQEVTAIPTIRPHLKAESWHQISGAFAAMAFDDTFQPNIVIDLPRDAELLLSEPTLEEFPIEQMETADSPPDDQIAVPLSDHPLVVTEMSDKDVLSATSAPAVYGSDLSIDGDTIKGWALTSADTLSACLDRSEGQVSVPLNGLATSNGVSFGKAAINYKLEGDFLSAPTLSIRTHASAGWNIARLMHQVAKTMKTPKKAEFARDRQDHLILLWAPISTAGLTVQLEQVAAILKRNKFNFKISYHMRPRIDHPLCKHWVDPRDIDSPKLVIYFERFVEFDRGFDAAFKVFYMNLDWLSNRTAALAKSHAKVVLCPTPYMLDELSEEFENSKVVYMPWPAQIAPNVEDEITPPASSEPIRVLYVGNDYDDASRKHPFAVVDAVEQLQRDDIIVDLKFRSPLPTEVRQRLMAVPCVGEVIDWSAEYSVVQAMYERAHINLIPNACEGNGLSILESWASNTIPAVLDGHPMKDVTAEENSFRIACTQTSHQERAPYYETTTENVLAFLQGLTHDQIRDRIPGIRAKALELVEREKTLEKELISCVMLSGIRTRGLRARVEEAHLPSGRYKNLKPRGGDRVRDLMFSDEGQSHLMRRPRLIDVMLTTSRRPWCLRQALEQLTRAMRASPFEHRLFVAVDNVDTSTAALLQQYSYAIEQVLWTNSQMGLPYTWNMLNEMMWNTVRRSERRPDYVCYIQDDCELTDPDTYFEAMGSVAYAAMPGYLGYVSGFYTEVHPGFADFEWNGHRVIATDSIDGKNFMAAPEIFASVGPLTWHFSDGMRRGNPGPIRGSHFDLWQWKESPNSLLRQNRISLILPDLCKHAAKTAADSTWNNDTTDESTQKRIENERVYQTRKYGEKPST